ncbi:S-adenosyl-L-methionine-dependent methyltransferase [Phellopilus nigrolimitatus]|nr:S-adenosyl-L-methionine-dependent methyltransferase [Phellopilus nigrolimitatus]
MLLEGMPSKGLRILNIGFGLGMIDTYFQEAQPASHVIIEGHPQALAYMRRTGWYAKPGVKVLAGRWQTFLGPACAEHERNFDIGKFDIVYFDTFMEGYRGHHAFIRHVPRLLRGPGSRFSFFHGHGAKKRATTYCYSEINIDDETRWESVHKRGEGMGLEHPHLIPISSLAPTVPRTAVPGVAWNPYPSRMHL